MRQTQWNKHVGMNDGLHIPEHLWKTLELMEQEMGVPKNNLVCQAIFTLARLNGYVLAGQVFSPRTASEPAPLDTPIRERASLPPASREEAHEALSGRERPYAPSRREEAHEAPSGRERPYAPSRREEAHETPPGRERPYAPSRREEAHEAPSGRERPYAPSRREEAPEALRAYEAAMEHEHTPEAPLAVSPPIQDTSPRYTAPVDTSPRYTAPVDTGRRRSPLAAAPTPPPHFEEEEPAPSEEQVRPATEEHEEMADGAYAESEAEAEGEVEAEAETAPLTLYVEIPGEEPVAMEGDEFTIGRGKTCSFVIESNRVSRQHARITREGDSFFLEDLNSSNGTFYGKQREKITRREIVDGDEFMFGTERVTFYIQ